MRPLDDATINCVAAMWRVATRIFLISAKHSGRVVARAAVKNALPGCLALPG
jgi:hypothetical protein